MSFEGKRVLVTGASAGLGRELTRVLVQQGARVAASGRSLSALEETRSLTADPSAVHACPGDLRRPADRETVVAAARGRLGEIDVLMNVAGVWHNADRKFHGPPLAETPEDEIDEVLDVGVKGALHLTRLVLPGMIAARAGKVVFFSCGFAGPAEASGWVHYYVTNKAIDALVAGLGAEVRPHGIQVNAVAPWFVATDAVKSFYPDQIAAALSPADVVDTALFLASSRANHISGQVIEVRSSADV